jgi:hypothetical protein
VRRLVTLALIAAAVPAGAASAQTPAPEDSAEQQQQSETRYPRCFGAASRDPMKPCRNPALTRMVRPKPFKALLEANSECKLGERSGELTPCSFGVPPEQASETIALIGDSHAAHWRAAIDTVVAAKRWHGISFTKAGCPFSTAVTDLPEPGRSKCIRFKRQLFRWFERHPEVQTVITSNHTGGAVEGTTDDYGAHVQGYADALRALPPTVQRIFSIRDVPRNTVRMSDCVARAVRRKIEAGRRCAATRGAVLKPDPAVPAAAALDPRRVQLIDMTRFMCTAKDCLPVVGGALVHKDPTHLTRVFASTLGPYLLRHVDRALSHMAAGTRP